MPDSIFRIWSIALYEAKVIMRGWLFRIALLLPVVFLVGVFVSSVFRFKFVGSLISGFMYMPSSIPWMMAVLSSVYACVILAAVAVLSGASEWDQNTLEGIRVRRWMNIEYCVGKIAGQVFCFLLMVTAVLLLSVGIAFFSSYMILESSSGFLFYPVIICIPAFIFTAGLSMFVTKIVRNQMLSLMIVMSVVVASILTADRFFHLFDLASFRMPLLYSRITGLAFPELVARQRLLYIFSGLLFICASAVVSRRLPGRRSAHITVSIITALLLAAALYSGGSYADHFIAGAGMREKMRRMSAAMRPLPRLIPVAYEISLDQRGRSIDCQASMILENGSGGPIDRYVMTLNPGLSVSSVESCSAPLDYSRDTHILTVLPRRSLRTGERDTIDVQYRGVVDGRAMYSDVPESIRGADVSFGLSRMRKGLALFRLARETAPVRDDYLLLTPEAMWYPVPGLQYDPRYPGEDRKEFPRFRLCVRPRAGLAVISQGEKSVTEDEEFIFECKHGMTGMTLAVGDFRTRSLDVDSIPFRLHSTPASEDLFEPLHSVSDKLSSSISASKEKLEHAIGLDYPFDGLELVEVPSTFGTFKRPLRRPGSGYVQPGMVLLHERGRDFGLPSLPVWLKMQEGYFSRDEGEQREKLREESIWSLLGMGVSNLFRDSNHSIYPMYFSEATGIRSSHHPMIGPLFDNLAREGARVTEKVRDVYDDGLTDSEWTSRMISNGDFLERSQEQGHYLRADMMVGAWSAHHYYLIDAMSESGAITGFIKDLVDSNRFTNVDEDELLDLFADRFGFRLESIMIDFEGKDALPGYIIGDKSCCTFIDGERERYRFSLDVWNRENASGVIVVTGHLKYPKEMKGWQRTRLKAPVFAIDVFEPGERKRIDVILDYEPATIHVNTMLSRNIPSKLIWRESDIALKPSCAGEARNAIGMSLDGPEEGNIIVDDTDLGFETVGGSGQKLLKRLFPRPSEEMEFISGYNIINDPPGDWRCAIDDRYYGSYLKSARTIKAGKGNAKAIWRAQIPESGYYDVFCYIHVPCSYLSQRSRSRKGMDRIEHHYSVSHADGPDEVLLMPEKCGDGWNLLGRYYFDEGEAVVELSNDSPVLYILADAVKWVKVN